MLNKNIPNLSKAELLTSFNYDFNYVSLYKHVKPQKDMWRAMKFLTKYCF